MKVKTTMHAINNTLSKYASFAPIILRVILGALLFWHGIDKFDTGMGNVSDAFEGWGVPLPGLTAPLTAVLEIVGGAALVVGAFTRVAAGLLSLVLIGALLFVKLEGSLLGGGSETDFAYLAGLLALVLLGPGRLSVDEATKTDNTMIDLRSSQSVSA